MCVGGVGLSYFNSVKEAWAFPSVTAVGGVDSPDCAPDSCVTLCVILF